jgi:signal transduction histidine kinase
MQGPDKGETLDVSAGGCTIGRGTGEVQLQDNTVSRNHAHIFNSAGKYYIEDTDSANGTYVNGVRIANPLQLKQGDHIRMGRTVLVFSQDQPIELPPDDTEFGQLVDLDVEGQLVDSSIVAALPADHESLIAPPEPARAHKHLSVLYELVSVVSSIFNIEQLLHEVMELIFREIPVDRGFILLRNDDDRLEPLVVKYRHPNEAVKITTSNTIIDHVVSKGEAVLCTNAMSDRRFSMGDSVQDYGLRSVICAPLVARDRILGVIHIDTSITDTTYTTDQLHLLTAIGYQSGLAVYNVQLYQEAIKAERLAATGQTVAALSHYIKNILQGLQGGGDTVELGMRGENIKTIETGWKIVNRNLNKIQNLMLNMLAFSKEREPRLEPIQVNVIVEDVLDLTRKQADDRGVMLIADPAVDMPAIPADPDGIHQVILNIMNNAIEAVPANTGVITIRTGFDESAQEAVITVGDNGSGIDETELAKIFEVFHSTKGHGGTGLGLAVAKKIVDEHNGRLEVRSHSGEGTVFTIRVPVDQPERRSGETTSAGTGRTK